MMHEFEIGKHIHKARKKAGLTQAELSKGICSERTLQKWEYGACEPGIVSAYLMAARMGISLETLIGVDYSGDIETANDYQRMAERTINKANSNAENAMHALHGMVGEIGELHSMYQKIYQGHEFNEIHAKKELGDLLWFIAEYCTANGWKLSDVMALNIEKLKARYPAGFDTEKSLNRKAGDI